jgi:hypothetical protein
MDIKSKKWFFAGKINQIEVVEKCKMVDKKYKLSARPQNQQIAC